MKNISLVCVGLVTLGVGEVHAGIKGSYRITGSEVFYGDRYSFSGTMVVTGYKTCKVNLTYNDGDRASLIATFKTALKETKNKQVVSFTWKSPEANGTGTATFSGSPTKYTMSFTYKTIGLSGRGAGSKRL
jgi:hypothetical protein